LPRLVRETRRICKLARETKAAAILQLSFYSELLGEMHGGRAESTPENMWIVHPGAGFKEHIRGNGFN
jgi:hypothetical protein